MRVTLLLLSFLITQITFAQEKTISGIVSDESGGLPGVSIIIKGTTSGVESDFDGNFTIQGKQNDILIFSFVGKKTIEKTIGSSNRINVSMVDDENLLNEVVVTALGIKREKKSLGYATQEVKGGDLTKVNSGNVANSISGKISGIEIRRNGNIGGSTNVIIRGSSSLSGTNQALWVVDGVPLNNSNTNTADQRAGGNTGGYDYGNAASDINPDDIESMNVLKGAAATALYGERASNGVIIVTTKKGKAGNGLGVTISSGVTIGSVDFNTLPKYQKQYGSGWWNPFTDASNNIDLGDGSHPYELTDDASWGPAYDANLLVYRWNSFHPSLSTYGKATPWTAPVNDANSFYQNSIAYTNTVALSGGNDQGNFRFSYSKYDLDQGILPNSSYNRDIFNLSSSYNLSDKTTITASANYTKTKGEGLNETGYGAGGNNFSSSIRQWYSSSVDFNDLKKAYNETGENTTWNVWGPNNLGVAFHDNPYFQRKENYNNMSRSRFFGNFSLTNEIKDWVSVTAKASIDTYSQSQEERIAVGSKRNAQLVGAYSRLDRTFSEMNFDLMLNFNTEITDRISFLGMFGANARRSKIDQTQAFTKGGLVIPRIYAISNSKENPNALTEAVSSIGTNSVFASASFSYDDTFFIEGTYRIDKNSTLPASNNVYKYPSISGTYLFSKNLKTDWLSFGKLRLNYAETGAGTGFDNIVSGYDKFTNFGGQIRFSNQNTKKNANLKPEITSAYEAGLELKLFKSRVGLDLSLYTKSTVNQAIAIGSSASTGYTNAWVNAGEIENKGIEVSLNVVPVKTEDFSWETQINWSKNNSKVKSLNDGSQQMEVGRFQGISSVAKVGSPLGLMVNTGYEYLDGKRVIGDDGYYVRVNDQVIGDVNADWSGGINNKLRYKRLSFSFLVDMKKGGDVWSLDQKYGQRTGIYETSVGDNDLGNPMRNPITTGTDSGGIILPGVLADGTVNQKRIPVYYSTKYPEQQFVYDASYIKLREVSLSYSLPSSFLEKSMFNDITFSASGTNLWIIHKNLPYADPEAGASSGNLQGFQTGAMPSTKEYSFNVKVKF
ncbi:SusC/RagA family TonB-linked outer membrane protein [Tenacibaculum ovolyticum]|uniref:SusC/RagA family TonB-linked outer membrane protein n=1 Tax=Tenacibaculum ovolyticum TaxID=104270 RepID=UPI001EED8120|nr:SusC/RagA family TonB-linked outer membrane protein [Tenacibaculum ovolyticum]